jgi:alginate O-acetyltransferase complex protein AlgI
MEFTKGRIYKLLCWFGTYLFICICWVFFRANSFATALTILGKLFKPSSGVMWIYPQFLVITAVVMAATCIKFIYSKSKNSYEYMTFDLNKVAWIFSFLLCLLIIFFMGADNTSPFIYFQF